MRWYVVLLALVFCLSPLGGIAAQDEAQQAESVARAYVQDRFDTVNWEAVDLLLLASELRSFAGGRLVYLVSFFSPGQDGGGAFYWVYVTDDSGEVMAASEEGRYLPSHDGSPEMSYVLAETERWEQEQGLHWTLWSYAGKAAFLAEYGYGPGHSPAAYGIPAAGDLTYDEALTRMREAMGQTLGASLAFVDDFALDAAFLSQSPGSPSGSWMFMLREDWPDVYSVPVARFQIRVPSPDGEVDILMIAQHAEADPISVDVLPGTLGYNAAGGKYFHAADRCESVDESYLPLTMFPRETLYADGPTQLLQPCPYCIFAKF